MIPCHFPVKLCLPRPCPLARPQHPSSCPLCLCTPGSPPHSCDSCCRSQLSSSPRSIIPCYSCWPGPGVSPPSAPPCSWRASMRSCTCSMCLWSSALWSFWLWCNKRVRQLSPGRTRSVLRAKNWLFWWQECATRPSCALFWFYSILLGQKVPFCVSAWVFFIPPKAVL